MKIAIKEAALLIQRPVHINPNNKVINNNSSSNSNKLISSKILKNSLNKKIKKRKTEIAVFSD